jgi:hypothetical protein
LNYSVKQGSLYSDIEKIVNDLHSIIDEFIYVYVGEDALNNPTIQALALVDITNVVDNKYVSAFGTGSSKMPMVGMSNMMANMMMTNMSNINTNNSEKQSFTQEKKNNTHNSIPVNTLTNMSDYQTAQALAIQAQAILNNQLAIKKFPNITATTILQLGKDIDTLKTSINNKAPYEDIMTIIHGRIHPLLITAYNLK